MNDIEAIENPWFYWTKKFNELPIDIQNHIRAMGRDNESKMIEITRKTYSLINDDLVHSNEFKPYYAFATLARTYCRKKKEAK